MVCRDLACPVETLDKTVKSADLVEHPDMNANEHRYPCLFAQPEVSIKISGVGIVIILAVNQFQCFLVEYFFYVFI